MERWRVIPEYEPVDRLYLSFVQEFFNTRFAHGRAIAEMARAARSRVEVVIFCAEEDLPHLAAELGACGLGLDDVTVVAASPGRGSVNEWAPIFCRDGSGKPVALTFPWGSDHPDRAKLAVAEQFGWKLADELGLRQVRLPFDFGTAKLAACDEFVFICEDPKSAGGASNAAFLAELLADQEVIPVPGLAGDITGDLDMCILPIGPRAWVVSEYPPGSPQAASLAAALAALRERGQTVHRVPGLEPIRYDDIDTMPNYVNCVLLNGLALVPSYARREDDAIQRTLSDCGFEVLAIDCRQIILSNSALHCISKTLPIAL